MTYTQRVQKIANILIFLGIVLLIIFYFPVIRDEVWYALRQKAAVGEKPSVFASYLFSKPLTFDPINKNFSIVIEKIGVNAPIKADVPVSDAIAYHEALKDGVAHASLSQYPSNS